jgi:pimeloyl-ACP methyl ester carboxylesterase
MKAMMVAVMMMIGMTLGAASVDPIDAYIAWSRAQLAKDGLTRKTTADGAVYWTGGAANGKTLVLLHGVNDQAGTWAAVVPLLARDYRLIIPDLAGHGESEPKSGPITFAAMLKQVDAIVTSEAKGKVTVAGNSMGGWIAMLYALEHPAKVERLVLEDASGLAWDLSKVPLRPTNREEAIALMHAVYGPETKTPDELLDSLLSRKNPPLSRIGLPDVMQHLVDARLKELKVPVAIVWGRDDGILSLDYAKALHEKIAGSTLTILDGAAHIPHRQQPEKFVQCLKPIS